LHIAHNRERDFVVGGIDGVVGIAVPLEKCAQAENIGIAGCADQHGARQVGVEKTHAAEHQRADNPLSELGLRDQ
jgi:hypothetical protein